MRLMWCYVCGREYRPEFERCWECDATLVPHEPTSPLLATPTAALLAGPHFEDREYDADSDAILAAAREALIVGGWTLRSNDLPALALAGSKRENNKAMYKFQEVAVYLLPGSDGRQRVRCGMQYSGSWDNRRFSFAGRKSFGDQAQPSSAVTELFDELEARLNNPWTHATRPST